MNSKNFVKLTKRLLVSFFVIPLLSCQTVKFPDVKACSVAGILAAGMDCAFNGHPETSEMDAKETIDFLESGAICMSADDRRKEKDAAEQACYLLKDRCTFEMKKAISKMDQTKRKK